MDIYETDIIREYIKKEGNELTRTERTLHNEIIQLLVPIIIRLDEVKKIDKQLSDFMFQWAFTTLLLSYSDNIDESFSILKKQKKSLKKIDNIIIGKDVK